MSILKEALELNVGEIMKLRTDLLVSQNHSENLTIALRGMMSLLSKAGKDGGLTESQCTETSQFIDYCLNPPKGPTP